MMHFSPCFRFPPLFSTNFQTLWKIFKILPFPERFFDFHSPKFLMTFFSLLVSRKLLFPPYFHKFPPCFLKIHLLFTCFLCISFSLLLLYFKSIGNSYM